MHTSNRFRAISSNNKGFKMLSKLGWNKGESLGKGQGLLEPVRVTRQNAFFSTKRMPFFLSDQTSKQ